MQPRTCVITVNYNGAADTAACLKSLQGSTVPVTVVVVDNTPNDPELETVIEAYPDVTFIGAPKNLGFGGGNNLGVDWALAHTDCEFIFILNNDAAVDKDTISKLESSLDKYPEAALVAPKIVFMDKPDVLWFGGGEVSWLRGTAIAPGYLGDSNAPLAMQAREISFASGCAMLIRRHIIQQLKGFDERFFMYEEDLELCLRIQELGWKIRYEPGALVHHVVQASSRGEQGFVLPLSPLNKNLPFYVFHLVRNRLISMRVHAKGKNRLVFIVGFTLLLLKNAILFVVHGRWDGIVAIMKGWRSYRSCFSRADNRCGIEI